MTRDLTTAVHLMRAALEPAAAVESSPERDEAPPAANRRSMVIIRQKHPDRKTTLTLQPSDRPDDDEEDDDPMVVLVLRRAPISRLNRLRAADRQFVDVARGAVRLHLPWLFIDRTDLEIPVASNLPTTRAFLEPFGDRASIVTRLLVEQPARKWGAREIAAEAGVSTMTASHVLRQLRELDVIVVHKRGRAFEARLKDLQKLVERWTRVYEWRRSPSLTVDAPIGSTERFMRRLPTAFGKRRWALTLQAGASLVAPHASWDTVHLYVDVLETGELEAVAHEAGWTPGTGRLVLMRPWYMHSAWIGMRTIQGLPVVSELQLVLDLWHYPVRGREQAETLMAKIERTIESARTEAQ